MPHVSPSVKAHYDLQKDVAEDGQNIYTHDDLFKATHEKHCCNIHIYECLRHKHVSKTFQTAVLSEALSFSLLSSTVPRT